MNAPWIEVLQKFVPAEISGHALHVMLYNSINTHRRDLSIFVFLDRQARPRWVIRCHHDRDIVQRQFAALQALARAQCDCQPAVLGATPFDDLHALLLRFCEGKLFSPETLLNHRALLAQVMATLVRVQKTLANGANQTLTPIALETLLSQNDLAMPALKSRVERAMALTQELQLPILPQHSDFVWTNLLQDRQRLVILDWEHVAFTSVPFFDAWTLALSLLPDFSLESFQRLFRASPASATAVYILQNYAQELGIPAYPARELFPLVLANFIVLNKQQHRAHLAGKLQPLLEFYLSHAESFLPGDLH